MKPGDFLAWVMAVTAAVLIVFGAVFFLTDWYHGNFTRLTAFFVADQPAREIPIITAGLAVLIAAIPATFIVRYFRSSKGSLEFSALGVRLKGPAGPILLWVAAFLASAAVLLVALRQ